MFSFIHLTYYDVLLLLHINQLYSIQIKLAECKRLNEQLVDLRKELNDTKSQVVVAEYKRETDIQNQDRKAQEEISSLQHLVHGKIQHKKKRKLFVNKCSKLFFFCSETVEESSLLKSEIDRLAAENDRLRAEIIHSHSSHSPQVRTFSIQISIDPTKKKVPLS